MTFIDVNSRFAAVDISVNQFLDSVAVWCNKPHVVNRRLCGSRRLWTSVVNYRHHDVSGAVDVARRIKDTVDTAVKSESQTVEIDVVTQLIRDCLKLCSNGLVDNSKTLVLFVMMRLLIPKQNDRFNSVLEVILIGLTFFCLYHGQKCSKS